MRLATTPAILLFVMLLAGTAHAVVSPVDMALFISSGSPGTYAEIGDAGDRLSPQPIAGVDITGITGTIGEGDDFADAFKFFFPGGDVAFVGVALFESQAIALPLELFQPSTPAIPPDPVTPDSIGAGQIGFFDLPAGNYIVETTFRVDPPFSIGVFTLNPDGSLGPPTIILPPAAVPAPASAVLVVLGIVAVWRARRRSRSC